MSSIKNILSTASYDVTYEDCCNYWKSLQLNDVNDYVLALENFKILFTCNTSCIEGEIISYHNTKELFENGTVKNFSGNLCTLLYVNNQKILFPAMIQDIVNGTSLSVDLIKRYHKTLMTDLYDDVRYGKGERAGEFKKGDYCVGVSEVGSPPECVCDDVNELLENIVKSSVSGNENHIKAAAYLHCAFEEIHPFADGNGRLGRVLMNYYLMINGLPPIVIFDKDKDTYYMGLEVFDRTGDISGFVLFIKEQMVATWKNRIRR